MSIYEQPAAWIREETLSAVDITDGANIHTARQIFARAVTP